MPVRDYQTGAYFCWCGSPLPFRTVEAVSSCEHRPAAPYVPGVAEHSWCPTRAVPSTVAPAPAAITPRPRLLRRVLLTIAAIAAFWVACVAVGLWYAQTYPAPAPAGTPSTYGPPGPRGGPAIPGRPMPSRWSR